MRFGTRSFTRQPLAAAVLVVALGVVLTSPEETWAAPPRSLAGLWRYSPTYAPSARTLPAGGASMKVPSNWTRQGWDRDGTLWFVRTVEVPAGAQSWRLALDGVDYRCEVYWDGQLLASHTGYFAPFVVPLPSRSGEHVLAIAVDSPREPARAWSLRKTLIKGVLSHHDTRPGGAWSPDGQDATTGGIWGDVRLEPATTAWLDHPRATTLRASAEAAELALTSHVTPLTSAPVAVAWQVRSPRGAVVADGAWTGSGAMRVAVAVPRPERWWPRELGAPALYTLTLRAGTDQVTTRFGIRTVTRDDRARYRINDTPVFLRGTNYIGSLYLSELDRAAVKRDLELMVRANVNAIRVHAHVTSPAFYDLADELGLMVWQDFPLQWGYDDSPAFAAEAARQLGDMLQLLGGHPSVIHWSAQNEAPWSSEWMVYKYPDYDPDQNRRLSTALAAVLDTDPSRPSQVNSGSAEHAWMGWYSGKYQDFARPQAHPVLTEYGAQALPELATLRTILRPEQLWPLEPNLPAWHYHNFQDHELFNIAKVPRAKSLAELITSTQAYQARLVQFAAESLRRQAWQPITAIFQFMFVEHWPSMNWGVVDYLRRPKPGYEALRRAYQPVLAIAYAYRKGALRLHVVNDRPNPEDVLIVATRELAGKVTYRRRLSVRLPGGAATAADGELSPPSSGEALRLIVTDLRNHPISENYYAPGYFAD